MLSDKNQNKNDLMNNYSFKSIDSGSYIKPVNLRSGVDEEFLDRMRNIEENIERNYKGPINQNELN